MTTKPNKTRSFAALFLLLVFAAYIAVGAITYSRFIDGFVGESAADVAQGVAYYSRGSLYYNGDECAYDPDSDEMVISAIAPGETVDYYFSVSGTDAETRAVNEVLLEVRVIFSVRLELLWADGENENMTQTLYFSARDEENDSVDYLNQGRCSLYTVSNAGTSSAASYIISPPDKEEEDTGIDYITGTDDLTNNLLHTEITEEGAVVVREHMTGLYLLPVDGPQEYDFRLNVVLPEQAGDGDKYSDARAVIDVRIEARQITELP